MVLTQHVYFSLLIFLDFFFPATGVTSSSLLVLAESDEFNIESLTDNILSSFCLSRSLSELLRMSSPNLRASLALDDELLF